MLSKYFRSHVIIKYSDGNIAMSVNRVIEKIEKSDDNFLFLNKL